MVAIEEVTQALKRHVPAGFTPRIGMILGSGLSSIAAEMTNVVSVPYQAIPGLQTGAVAGHASIMLMGDYQGTPVLCMRGRLHLYEGTPYESLRIFIRLMKHVGCEMLLITCAAGSMREEVGAGELMMITDHINCQPGNPLSGPNDESVGPRFVSMDDAYDSGLQTWMAEAALQQQIMLYKGVYIATLGPSFETPAEIRAYRQWGADAVGMSLVPEVLLARHCGLKVVAVSAITNLAAGMTSEKLSHEGTLHFGEIAARKLVKLIPAFIQEVKRNGLA